ncbi:unnamed protein product [Eruca vesicaria subsp. sativa]|uniref:TF-B3 domain-containing protein n=1 Tax=Eruca vesicaria subsp. sativa TaxID=29727 RepID=A0ABC8JEZ3_ERUVS|nr:unnamed protein product [Eruca vesicaria subsp. sativa]
MSRFALIKRHAIECLPPLDMSQPTPSQEIIAKDIHGQEWKFKHTLRGNHKFLFISLRVLITYIYFLTKNQLGTPQKHLFTSGWNEFVKEKDLIAGDSFVFLRYIYFFSVYFYFFLGFWIFTIFYHRGENGESRVGIQKIAYHQQRNKLSKESMHHGVVVTASNAIKNKSMFVVFYKPRSSQFLVNFDKVFDGVNKKFSIGSRFSMKFEGSDFNEIRYRGTIIGVSDFSTHWKDSEWRSLEVHWDKHATIPRPDKVSPWEIELSTHSSNLLESDLVKNKRQNEVYEFGSNMSVPTLTQGQEVGNSSARSSMSCSLPTMAEPNYNEQMLQAEKEMSTTTGATSYRLFGVDLTIPENTKDPVKPINSHKKPKISKHL